MGHGIVHIDLPEAREPLPDFLVRQNTDAERRLTFDILVECDLGTGQQADRNVRLSDRRESANAARAWGGQPIATRRLRFSAGPRLPEPHERSCSPRLLSSLRISGSART